MHISYNNENASNTFLNSYVLYKYMYINGDKIEDMNI